MDKGIWFWVLFVIGLLLGLGGSFGYIGGHFITVSGLFPYILIGLLGLGIYGSPLK